VILVGLPGAGKTTVGALAAARLGTWFLDLDEEIERREAMPIAQIFAERGEAMFRDLERQVMADVLARKPGVIAAGGGWAAQSGNQNVARRAGVGRALILYLNTGPETAAARTAGTTHRPLLGGDHSTALYGLLARRGSFYQEADAKIETDDRTADEVAVEVVALAHAIGVW
jgi:shikimate kinase